jgi:hypothetical protein
MTKLHDENFYTYHYDLLKDEDFVLKLKPIEQEPDQPGGGSPWSGGRRSGGLMLRRARDSEADIEDVPQRPDTPIWDPPPADIPPNAPAPEGAQCWLDAVGRWQEGIYELRRRRHDRAAFLFSECQQFGIEYFGIVRKIPVAGADIHARVSNILSKIASDLDPNPQPPPTASAQGPRTLRRMLEARRSAPTLALLHFFDWSAPVTSAANVKERVIGTPPSRLNAHAIEVLQHIAAVGIDDKLQRHFYLVHQKLDYFMIVLLSVFVPVARAEMERDRQRYEAAVSELDWVLGNATSNATPDQFVVNEPIELPFIRLLLAECLIEQGDSGYKAETPISPLPPPPPPPARLVRHDWMKARTSYERAIAELGSLGSYAAQVTQAVAKLDAAVAGPEPDLAKLGKEILIDTIKPVLKPGEKPPEGQERMVALRNTAATAPLLEIGEATSTDTNPRVFALLLQAHARLVQLRADFNWLGYRDYYVPPWRFQFLLERGRYFAEHAKQAQRDYLNFLSTAEREELQENSAEQAVALERANIVIEDARVEQAIAEKNVADKSHDLAFDVQENSGERLTEYKEFDSFVGEHGDTNPRSKPFRRSAALCKMVLAGAILCGVGSISEVRAQMHAQSLELIEATIPQLQWALSAGIVTSHDPVTQYLARIEAYDQHGPALNAISVTNANALAEADARDAERQAGARRGPLLGIPIIVKDNYDTRDLQTAAGSKSLAGWIPPDDAFLVTKLREAGAIIIAKSNMHEFAYGITTLGSLFGQTRNPYALDRNPGGSSGGTGAAIAASLLRVLDRYR